MMIILRAILRAEDEQQDDDHPADYPPRGAPPPLFRKNPAKVFAAGWCGNPWARCGGLPVRSRRASLGNLGLVVAALAV